jgi:cytochrome c oxidase subunit 3
MRRVTPFADREARFLAGQVGMKIFLVSLGILFGATLIGFLVMRIRLGQLDQWPTDLPPLPRGLWLSTLTLLVSSATIQWALHGVRSGRPDQLRVGMLATLVLAFVFLAIQSQCWLVWMQTVTARWSESAEYRFALTSFYILTVLHALHVIGGLIPMIIVTRNAFRGNVYTLSFYPGVLYCAMYWHFLDAVWVVLFATLMIGI